MDNIVEFPESGVSLETIETLCLNYLRQAENPLVAVEALFDYCVREAEPLELSEDRFRKFLNDHPEVVILPGMMEGAVPSEWFDTAGIHLGERAVHAKRFPTQEALTANLAGQLQQMQAILKEAREVALGKGETEKAEQMADALTRAEALLDKMKALRDGGEKS